MNLASAGDTTPNEPPYTRRGDGKPNEIPNIVLNSNRQGFQNINLNLASAGETSPNEPPYTRRGEGNITQTERSGERERIPISNNKSEDNSPVSGLKARIGLKFSQLLKVPKVIEPLEELSPILPVEEKGKDSPPPPISPKENKPPPLLRKSKSLKDSITKSVLIKGASKTKSDPRSKFSAKAKLRSFMWSFMFPFMLEKTVERSTEKLRNESSLLASKDVQEQTEVLIRYIEKHCGAALTKMYKDKASFIIVDDGSLDEPIAQREWERRCNNVLVSSTSFIAKSDRQR